MTSPDEPENPISQFHKDLQTSEAKPLSASRTAADDIIETIGGGPPPTKRGNACPSCGSGNFVSTRPLGGAPRHTCQDCRCRWYGVPRGSMPIITAKGTDQTSTAGPYYRGSPSLPAATDPHSPKSRTKAKTRKTGD